MKAVQASDMTDGQWQSYSEFSDYLKREIYPQFWDGKDTDWNEIKISRFSKVSLTDNSFSNSCYIIDNNKVIAFIDAYDRRGNLHFVFNSFDKVIALDIIKIILNEIKKIMILNTQII